MIIDLWMFGEIYWRLVILGSMFPVNQWCRVKFHGKLAGFLPVIRGVNFVPSNSGLRFVQALVAQTWVRRQKWWLQWETSKFWFILVGPESVDTHRIEIYE